MLYNPYISGFIHKEQIIVEKTPPTINVWYDVLNVTRGVELLQIQFYQINDETDMKQIATELSLDGIVYSKTIAANHDVKYFFARDESSEFTALNIETVIGLNTHTALGDVVALGSILAKACYLRARMITAVGTNQSLRIQVIYRTQELI